jgi:hypothetical protein
VTAQPLDRSQELDGLADSEDLFGFDERSAAAGESAQGTASNAEEDLFDFDEILALESASSPDVEAPPVEAKNPELAGTERDVLLPHPSPTAEHAVPAAVVSARLSLRSPLAWALMAFAAINLGLIGFTWKLSSDVRDRVDAATVDILQATRSIQEKTGEQIERIESTQKPFVSPETEGSETFERVEEDIAAGNFGSARRRLYALLAVSDRLGVEYREDVVARAEFRIADILLAQALASEEERP